MLLLAPGVPIFMVFQDSQNYLDLSFKTLLLNYCVFPAAGSFWGIFDSEHCISTFSQQFDIYLEDVPELMVWHLLFALLLHLIILILCPVVVFGVREEVIGDQGGVLAWVEEFKKGA